MTSRTGGTPIAADAGILGQGRDGYFSLSHKRRACLGAGPALEIMVYAAELPLSAA
jgi:hypothetical protein